MKGTNHTPPKVIMEGHKNVTHLLFRAMASSVIETRSELKSLFGLSLEDMGHGTGSTRRGVRNVHKVTNKFPPSLQWNGTQACERRHSRLCFDIECKRCFP